MRNKFRDLLHIISTDIQYRDDELSSPKYEDTKLASAANRTGMHASWTSRRRVTADCNIMNRVAASSVVASIIVARCEKTVFTGEEGRARPGRPSRASAWALVWSICHTWHLHPNNGLQYSHHILYSQIF